MQAAVGTYLHYSNSRPSGHTAPPSLVACSSASNPEASVTAVGSSASESLNTSSPATASGTGGTSGSVAAAAEPLQPAATPEPDGGRFARYLAASDGNSRRLGRQSGSSWDAIEAGGGRGGGADYLFELGQSDYNTNVDAGQNIHMIDSLFAGGFLGTKSDIADGSLRGWEFRTLNNIVGDYYVAPRFLEKVVVRKSKSNADSSAAYGK